MTYEQAMTFWFGRVNYEQKPPQAGDFKLGRMRLLLERLDNPHERLRIIHIAGSKGKGSTSAMLASILHCEGYRVGLFTSPHLVAVEERIQVDRQPIAHDELAALMTDIRDAVPDLAADLTFFEIGTALGFLHFVRRRVDFAVVEVGLGGRFDSTNVCQPLLAIITSISLDHTQVLGDTLAKIAFEKAGIVKPGRPTVSGVIDSEPRDVIRAVCAERQSALRELCVDFDYEHEPALIDGAREQVSSVTVKTHRREWQNLTLGLIGEHQARNAAVAVAATEELKAQGVPIHDGAVVNGLAHVVWPARLEIVSRRPLVLLDCAHNVASARALVQTLEASFPVRGRRTLIFGGNRDKDLTGMLDILAPKFDRVLLTSFHGSTRCTPAEQLMELLSPEAQTRCRTFSDPIAAWNHARAGAKVDDLICITGSVFLAGELRPIVAV